MSRQLTLHSLRWLVLACSAACALPAAVAQENPPAEPPRAERSQPAERNDEARDQERRNQPERRQDQRDDQRRPQDSAAPQDRDRPERGDEQARPDDRRADRQQRRGSRLGISFEEGDELLVRDIEPESVAARAGLRAGDRIISVNGREVAGQRRFSAFLGGMGGRRVPVIIDRNGRKYTVQLTPAESSQDGPWLGIYLQDNEEGQEGAIVTHVYPASPAARAGLRTGDVVLAVEDQQVENPADLIALLDEFEPRSKVNLRLRRGDQEIDATATLASRRDFMFQTSFDERGGEGGQQSDEDDPWSNLPPFAMQLEHDRRMAEQHERMENELRKLQEEVRALREAIERK